MSIHYWEATESQPTGRANSARAGWGLGWGLFLLVARTQRSKSAASRGPLYFAWGCFRDFLSGEQIDRTKTHLALGRHVRPLRDGPLQIPEVLPHLLQHK